jgi:DNA-binding response OmpR family regulator
VIDSPDIAVRRSITMRGSRILLVDDDDDLRASLASLLATRGADVREASGGGEALSLLADEPFDLVVTDVVMPAPPGTQLAAMARTAGAPMPILVITAYESEHIERTVRQLARATLLRKPFDFETFLECVTRMLEDAGERS